MWPHEVVVREVERHGCDSTHAKSVPVKETFEGQTAWEGIVEVFDLEGHPTATRCYAWSHALEGTEIRRYVAVLHHGPIDSPENAVRAAVVAEVRDREINKRSP